jgi:imidazolonepropionase-like amidohydrolase
MLVRNVSLWDGTGAPPRARVSLRIEGERIAWIGPDERAPAGAPDEVVVDADGRWLVPGLIDLHVHLTFDPAEPDLRQLLTVRPVPELALMGAGHARVMLEAGFTSARDCGAFGWANVALKRAIDAGWVPGPRLQTVGGVLTVLGGHFDPSYRAEVVVPAGVLVDGPDGARRAVRQEVKQGADWIKLLVTGGVMTGTTPLGRSLWDEAELRAAVGAARRLGRKVAAHCHGAEGMIAAAEAGVDTVEHGTMGDAAAAAAMARHGTILVPTMTAVAAVVRGAREGRLPPAVADQALRIERSHGEAFRTALEAGVRIAFGTDTGVPGTVFGENAQELGHLVANGLTPEQALLAATREAATVLGREADLGTLEPGKLADCLLVGADPLADAGALASGRQVHLVVQGGRVAADRRPER